MTRPGALGILGGRHPMRQLYYLILVAGLTFPVLSARAEVRENRLLMSDWRFKPGDIHGAEQPDYDAADWQPVSLPHNWGWEQAQKGENYLRGPGWYRRDLNIGKPEAGRRYYLRFEAAGSAAGSTG